MPRAIRNHLFAKLPGWIMRPPDFCRLLESLHQASRIFIQTHNFPDSDAIASAYGLMRLLEHFGIQATLCYMGRIEDIGIRHIIEQYEIPITEYGHIADMSFSDKIILVDGQKFNTNMTDLPGNEIACIDHHPDNHKCDYAYVDIRDCGACSSIIAEYYRSADVQMDAKTATLLMYGLNIDTNNMQRGVKENDIDAFRQLYPLADQNMLRTLAGRSMLEKDLKAFGTAFETLFVKNRLGIIRIPFACEDYLIAKIADFVLQLAEVDTVVVYSKKPEGLKFSARTILSDIHCGNMLYKCLIAEGGSAGGHPHMAGGFIPRNKIAELYDDNISWQEKKRNAEEFRDHLAKRLEKFLLKSI